MKTLTFYLIRHGKTEWNEKRLLQGNGDSPLTQEGIEGAKRTAKALSNIDFTAAYSSVLPRAISTANMISAHKTTPLICHAGLNELCFGSWEGQAIEELSCLPEYRQMRDQPAQYLGLTNGGETYQQLATRAMGVIEQIIQRYDTGNILIVSHGHTLRMLLALFHGATWQTHREKSTSLANTSISVVHYLQTENETGRFVLEKVNDIQHLTDSFDEE
ncbi:TPA: histidine phosphatase family protein [Pasteurella multocida]|uniref:histidine phosphatase family protein n=1 Tax=Pasteurella multocida TaxID=747 RepID=UPI0014616388|nr:histidine phosphatase family protein [Pasteurella multocida]NMR60899.1 histidine phosphatase family protein [Pasteurella multocida]HDR1000105.1 histidine phosphatase family protein [Pasteurella multocida]HDR1019997.1 histidine phosphatase family protein [Pasteurella multocida]HDR1032549.1 histidine phosphatase family protein [Pasteurella multocida]HDR1297502.1 histidine phosphatase family protein [Pasteurella multocida]